MVPLGTRRSESVYNARRLDAYASQIVVANGQMASVPPLPFMGSVDPGGQVFEAHQARSLVICFVHLGLGLLANPALLPSSSTAMVLELTELCRNAPRHRRGAG